MISWIYALSVCLKLWRTANRLTPEEFIFHKVVLWSEVWVWTCKRSFDGPVKVENQRWILRDIIKEIRFPIMEHQYLHDVICTSKILRDEEKVDILRQQLKTNRKNNDSSPCRFTCEPQKWHSYEERMFQFSRYSAYHGSSKSFSVKFRARSLSFLVGID